MQWRPRVNILGWMPGYSDSNARAAGALYKAETSEANALTTKINEHGPLSADSTDPREIREMAKPRYQDWARDYHEWSKDNPNSEVPRQDEADQDKENKSVISRISDKWKDVRDGWKFRDVEVQRHNGTTVYPEYMDKDEIKRYDEYQKRADERNYQGHVKDLDKAVQAAEDRERAGPAEPTSEDKRNIRNWANLPEDQEIPKGWRDMQSATGRSMTAEQDAARKLADDIRDSYDRPDREYDAPDNDEPDIEPAIGYRADWPRDAQTVIDQQAIEDSEEGWPGIRPGIRGAGVPGHAEQKGSDVGNRQDNTDATRKISLIDQIIGAAGDKMPAPGVEPGVHQTKGMEV